MSRRSFTHDDDTWTVGYDRPLHTFYAQVEPRHDVTGDPAGRAAFLERHPTDNPYAQDELLLTVAGDEPRELPTVGHLTAALTTRGVEVPPDVQRSLQRDHLQAVGAAPLNTVTNHDAAQAASSTAPTSTRPAGPLPPTTTGRDR